MINFEQDRTDDVVLVLLPSPRKRCRRPVEIAHELPRVLLPRIVIVRLRGKMDSLSLTIELGSSAGFHVSEWKLITTVCNLKAIYSWCNSIRRLTFLSQSKNIFPLQYLIIIVRSSAVQLQIYSNFLNVTKNTCCFNIERTTHLKSLQN